MTSSMLVMSNMHCCGPGCCRWCQLAGQCSACAGATHSGCWWQEATASCTYTRCAATAGSCSISSQQLMVTSQQCGMPRLLQGRATLCNYYWSSWWFCSSCKPNRTLSLTDAAETFPCTAQVDMTDVLRVKHARHNAQPSARQQQQQDGPTAAAEAAGLRALQAAGRHGRTTAEVIQVQQCSADDVHACEWCRSRHASQTYARVAAVCGC